ncbi:serpin family protein [Knoellia sp. S7-12]|uniref:serpin family protein n=1 Tax=Knoellia sp. S7-12 TaxID=3126698 RepID=UPI003365DB00
MEPDRGRSRHTIVMKRRDALQLAVIAAIASPLLAACGDVDSGDPKSGTATELELVRSNLQRSAGTPDAIPEVVAGVHSLAGGLYGRLAAKPGNLVLSPYSVAVALGMTLSGAGGRTAAEMRDVMGVARDAPFHGGLNALTAYIEGLAGPQDRADGSKAVLALDGANQLYGQQGVGWERDFLDLLAREYGAGLQTLDFQHAHEEARVLINDWVAGRTQDRIPELIPAGLLNPLTCLVLVNALYLKAPWETPFEKSLTQPRPFHLRDGSSVDVDTMVQTLTTTMAQGDGWRAARLPYAGRALAMTLVLPDPGRLREVEGLLTSGGLTDVISTGRRAMLDLRLPRWTFRTQAPLTDVLQRLGMHSAFDPDEADFRPMTEEDLDLHVSAVLHEGFIAVDEEGTEAAAATAVVVSVVSAPVTEPFHVDRPFLFVIHDVEYDTPLFLGRVDDPSA